MLALTRPPRRAAQGECLPLHLALYAEALDTVVLALLSAYPGAAMEQRDVRWPRPLLHRLYARSHLPAAALRRVMSCRCTWPRASARRRRWWWRCSQLTRALSRRGTAYACRTFTVPALHSRSHALATMLRSLKCCRCTLRLAAAPPTRRRSCWRCWRHTLVRPRRRIR